MPGSTFCNENIETITATNYMNKFTDSLFSGVKEKSCLPNGGTGFSPSAVNSDTGIVTPATLDSHVAALIASWPAKPLTVADLQAEPNLNSPTNDPAQKFTSNAQSLRHSIAREYCFYYKRYLWVLTDVLNKAVAGSTDTAYQDEKINAQALNSKLNQILQVLQSLINSRTTSLNSYYGSGSGVNVLNADLDKLRAQLVDHSTKLQNKALEQDVQSSMIEYSLEKNSSSRNLLGIYGFMNIVAIGLLFYLYRSSKN